MYKCILKYMANRGQLLTKKIKITPRTQDVSLKVSVLKVLCTPSLLPVSRGFHRDT